ncbi:hypothetical protein IP91_04514 [Pseudoduganella lurida]|uniref:Lipoprotein n=1 Tax=Pseudoduganella lurida TaxID=1036180 RepID=A0A562QYM9_9BURK|nr:DUF6279 family lipoprotein [Pseudoduganella lurida]TWI61915.1 hypothetical protein IP91_04514 [Pseudoduganella lurida]
MQSRSFRTWCAIALLAVLAACSSLKLAYNNGDTLLYWWLDNYVDFDGDQRAEVKKDIDNLFRWHRKTQLQDYTQFLQRAQKQLQSNPSPADLRADYDDIRARTQALLVKAAPDIADLALSLKPEQLDQMEKKFEKNNVKFRKENMKGSRDDQNEFRYKKSMEQFELWFGTFTSEQKAIIRKASDARPLDNNIWFDERQRRQRNVLNLARKIVQEKPSREQATAQIQALIRDSFSRMDNSERKPFFDSYTNSTIELVHTVIRIATPEQKAHAQKRMQGWIGDFSTLAAEVK